MPIVIETMQEFDARHSVDGPKLQVNGFELFPDGAIRDRMGNHVETPVEAGELLRAKRLYVKAKLRLEEEAFTNFKNGCEQQLANKMKYANTLPGPPADAKQQLERGAERIEKLRGELAAMNREISQLPEETAHRAFWEERRANQQAAREQLSNLQSFTIYHDPALDRLTELVGKEENT